MQYRRIFNEAARRRDIYEIVTNRVIADLEQDMRPWVQPWNTDRLRGRIMRPVRHNGQPYCPMWDTRPHPCGRMD